MEGPALCVCVCVCVCACVCVRAHGLLLYLIWELVKGDPCWRPSSQPQGLVAANNILESGRHQEVLLLQSELFPFKHLEKEGDERRTGEGRREGKGGGREKGKEYCVPCRVEQSLCVCACKCDTVFSHCRWGTEPWICSLQGSGPALP